MRLRRAYLLLTWMVLALLGCGNLEQEIELDLPPFEAPVALECYLETGKPYRLLITNSAAYFDDFPELDEQFLEQLLVQNAEVAILRGNERIELNNEINFDAQTQKVFNYRASQVVPEDYDSEFSLEVTLENGQTITGTTQILRPVPIDSVIIEFESETSMDARVLTYFFDDTLNTNFYRRILLDTLLQAPDQDFSLDDRLLEGTVVFGSGYDYAVGDTLYNYLLHIDEPYYDFINSVFISVDSNGNPFGQPSPIISNLKGTAGAIGIFTGPGRSVAVTPVE